MKYLRRSCEVTIWVVSLERDEIEIPKDVQLSCDGDYARIPVGLPFAGHLNPTNIGSKKGTGTPSIAIPKYMDGLSKIWCWYLYSWRRRFDINRVVQ